MALTGAVGAINVKVSADATGFNASMNKVASKVAATSKRVRDSANTYAKWGAVAATAALTIGSAMVKSQMKVLDSLAKTSDALGVQQKQLQALQHVAELTGTGAAQLSVNLERMQRRIGEVARKGGQAAAALSEIGVSASEMIELPADQQLVRISQAMVGVTNSSIKASIAMDLFGRDGVRMLKMMEQLGQDGIAPTVAELESLGVSLSRMDTAKVEQANDALFRTKQVTDGVVNQIAIKLSPLITQMGEDFLNAAKAGEGFGSTIDSIMKKSITVVGLFSDSLHGLKIVFKGLEIAGKTMGLAVVKVMQGALLGVQMFIDKSISSINNLIDNINVISGAGISSIERFELGAVQSFANLAESGKEQIASLVTEMHNMAMTQLPSDQFDAWVAKAEAAATAAATAATAANGEGGGSTVGLSDVDKVKMQEKLTAISESLMSETELKRLALETDLLVLKDALANELLAQSEHDQQKKALEAKTSSEITAIEDKAKKDRDNLAQAEKSAKINAVSQTFGGLSTLMNTESKKLFAIGKAAAIAGAVVDGYAAVSKTMASAPYPLNIGLAAAQGVASAVQIQGIAKQKIGGAQSMGATASFSGGTPTTNTSGGGGGMGDRNISISGLDPSSMFSGEQVRDLLKNMAGDGADFTFLTSGG
jgi:stress-induced morphogen